MTFIPLKSNALQGSEYARFEYFGRIPNDTMLEDILKPAWWVHWAAQLKPAQRVELVSEDFLLDVEVRVTRIADGLVWVNPLRITENKAAREQLGKERTKIAEAKAAEALADEPMPEGYKRGFSPKNGYFVVLKATGQTLKTGLDTKKAAVAWAEQHAEQSVRVAA